MPLVLTRSVVVRVARWLTGVMLLAALAPGFSRALAAVPAASWTVVCTSSGLRWLPLPGRSGSPPSDPGVLQASVSLQADAAHGGLDACGFCLLAAERFAPLVPAWHLALEAAPASTTPWYTVQAAGERHSPPATARGPPRVG